MAGLYIHIPFCNKVCDYCDFSVLSAPERMHEEYVELLMQEMKIVANRYPKWFSHGDTLYLGGGTPSILSEPLLEKLFLGLNSLGFSFEWKEATMEFNPESCTKNKLELARNFGINRFSLGVQTFRDGLLKVVGRGHSPERAHEALALLQSEQKENCQFSADLMFMLPRQSKEDFLEDLEILLTYTPDHISFYGLQISPKTMLESKIRRGILAVDDSLYGPMYKEGVACLKQFGYERYEVSNFACCKRESLHNLNYWHRGEYLGFGPSAHSYLNKVRFSTPSRYKHWKDWVLAGCLESGYEKDILDKKSEILEEIWLSLRLAEGLDLKKIEQNYGFIPNENKINHWIEKNYLAKEGARIFLIDDGWLMMDQVVEDLSE